MDFNRRTRPDEQMVTARSRGRPAKCALHCRPLLLARLAALPLTIALMCASAAPQAATTGAATPSTTTAAVEQLLVSTTTLASTSTGAARGVKRASQQQQQAPASLGSLLDQQQASIQSMMARPFYSIKDGKTSARRIQQQTPASDAQQQRDRQAAKTQPARQQATLLTGDEQPTAARPDNARRSNQLANSDDNAQAASPAAAAAAENQQVEINDDLAAGVGQQQQRQQMAGMMLIDSFNQLVGADGGQLTSDFTTTPSATQSSGGAEKQRAKDGDGLAASSPAAGNEQQNGLATSSPTGAIKQSGGETGASSQAQPPSSLSMSLDGMIVNSRPRPTQGVAGSSAVQEGASGEQTRATKGTKQRASANNQKSIAAAKLQNSAPPSSWESPSGQQVQGVERIGELPVREDNPIGNFNTDDAGTPTSFQGGAGAGKPANSRRVPFTGVPFSSPASKGQRTKPNASNQIGANLSSPLQVAKQQRQQEQAPRGGALQRTGSGATDQPDRAASVDRLAPSGFDEDSQQQRQPQTQPQEEDSLAAMIAARKNPNLAESSRPLATKLANGDMLMSLVSSSDGKERRLVMISRDTLDSLQRFAAQQQMRMVQEQQQQQEQGQSAETPTNSWWPASSERSPRPDEVQTTIGPQQLTTTTTLSPPVNLGATSLGGTRGSTSSPRLGEVVTQAMRADFLPSTMSTRLEQQLTTTTTVAPTMASAVPTSSADDSSTQRQGAEQPDDTFREVSIAKQASGVAKPQGGAKSQQTSTGGRQSGATTKGKQQTATGASKTVNKQSNRAKQNKQQQLPATSANKSSSPQQTQQLDANGLGAEQDRVTATNSRNSAKPKPTAGSNKGGRGKTTGVKQQRQKANQLQSGGNAQASSSATTTTTLTGDKRNKPVGKTAAAAPQAQEAAIAAGDAESRQTRPLSSNNGGSRQSAVVTQSSGQEASATTKSSGQQQQQAMVATTVSPSTSTLTNGQQLAASRLGANSASQQQARQGSVGAKRPSWSAGNESLGILGTSGSEATQTTGTLAPMSRGELDRQLDELERANAGLGDSSGDSGSRGGLDNPGSDGSDGERGSGGVFGNELEGLRAAIPGEPIVDYPIYSRPPERTSFQCQAQSCPGGYYADLEAQCQVFHVCQNDGRMDTFLCPNGTIFSQQHFVCVWWWQVECSQSAKFFKLNDGIYCNSMNLPGDENLLSSMDNRRLPVANSGQPSQSLNTLDFQAGQNSQTFQYNQQAAGRQASQDGATSTQQTDRSSFSTPTSADGSISSTVANSDASTLGSLGATTDASEADQPLTSSKPSDGRQTSPKPRGNNLNESELNQQQQQQLELLSRRAAAA